ncbi:imm11 family protein [Mangrovicella endophytica]|uniref:imm11 family protein n=1 Tax=Mangrovicella endophytica TaxID=2066697 RepID=UPI000C9DC25F|nr:DUF1629 domain-containing protein [Mangrovicella endophytica]
MPYLCNQSRTPRYAPMFEWVSKPDNDAVWRLKQGVRLAPEELPTHAQLRTRFKTLPDFIHLASAWGVTDAFRDKVEELEPGVHQFFPVTLLDPKGVPIEGAHYSILNVMTIVQAMDTELTHGDWIEPRRPNGKRIFEPARGVNLHMVLRRDVAGSLHLWRDALRPESGVFFSDVLWDWVQRQKLKKLVGERAIWAD